jgi:transcription initiation factor IIF auxiliary subunit
MMAAVPQSVLAQRHSEAPYQLQLVINNLHEETASTGNKSKWSMWVALRGLFNKHTATIIERVVYELDPTCKENCVTSYPPFFSLRRHGSAPSMVRCRIHWAPMLGIYPTTVDHYLTLGEKGNGTLRTIDVDRDALDTLELKVLKRVPSSIKQQTKIGPAKPPNVGPVSLNALGLEFPLRKTSKQLVFWVPPQTCTTQDESLLEVAVANRHTALPWQDDVEPCHEWTMYVLLPGFQMLKSAMIKQVVYNFGQDTYTLNAPNFELTCTGFAAFKVICTIYWNPTLGLQPTTLVHELVSNEIGGRTSATISVSPRRLQFFA